MSKLLWGILFVTIVSTLLITHYDLQALHLTPIVHSHEQEEPMLASHSQSSQQKSNTTLINPVPQPEQYDLALIQLGWTLFNDPNLSSSGQISCNTCHLLESNGAQNIPVSVGVGGAGLRNSPTVFNVSLNTRFFWDGRASSLESQIDGPITHPLEMDSTWQDIVNYVRGNEAYLNTFNTIDNIDPNERGIKLALSEFQRSLLTPDAPFDRYLKGDEDALSPIAKSGWQRFQQHGCVYCHQGTNIGGNIFQYFGYYDDDHTPDNSKDLGRFDITGLESDKNVFRVPSLRNVAQTAPYFHDGRTHSLNEAISIMSRMQLGKELSQTDIIEIRAFLESLTAPRPKVLEVLEQ